MQQSSTQETLERSLRDLATGLEPGARMPTVRELVELHGVSPVTVSKAVARLVSQGVLTTRPGSGTYVAPRSAQRQAPPDTAWQTLALADRQIDLSALRTGPLAAPGSGTIRLDGGYLHRSLQPAKALAGALARASRRPDAWDRAPAAGLSSLRSYFASDTDADVSVEDVLVTSGGQSALSLVFRAIGAPGDAVLVESPTYPGALAAIAAANLRPVPVPIGPDGVDPADVQRAFEHSGARLFYCQPTFHNPTGAIVPPAQRARIVEVARAAGAFVVEDDFARHLGHGDALAPSLLAQDPYGAVVQLTSLTKPAAPSLRVGAIIARGPIAERLQAARRVDDFFVSRPLQEAAVELVSSPAWSTHLKTLPRRLEQRRTTLIDALRDQLPTWNPVTDPRGGLHLWYRLPPGITAEEVEHRAAARGVVVDGGRRYFPAEPPAAHIRLSIAGTADLPALKLAVDALAQAITAAPGADQEVNG
ncbi:PLP-dependent aminotransferase family protein [Kribbella sp. HUAS MG21]|uniref:PLP-dependent aminotransferase family protein n=1 Tax=Kribbella sp. HUAS MG21 TaxID=3160966 RepID=A0AAU7T674_9ACTN